MNTIEPKRIFVDTSGWIEYILKGEKYHRQVVKYFTSEINAGSKIFTSDYVLDESFTRLLTNQGIRSAKKLKNLISKAEEKNKLLVLYANEIFLSRAWKYFEKFSEHKLSFTDAAIYTFIKDLKINEVLTLDAGFEKAGLTVKPVIR